MREGLLRKWNAFLTPHFARRTGTFDSDITCVATMAALPFSESIAATVRALDTVQAEIEHLTQQIQEVERTNPTDYVRLDGWLLLQQRLKGLEDDRRTCTRFAALLTFAFARRFLQFVRRVSVMCFDRCGSPCLLCSDCVGSKVCHTFRRCVRFCYVCRYVSCAWALAAGIA